MAKKKETKIEVKETQIKEQVVNEPKIKTVKKVKDPNVWEIKDRTYYLKNNKRPLSYMIRSANIYYFDEEMGYERELKYTSNQKTCFVDEMKGDQRLEHIIFRNGALFVPRNKTVLQKLLSLYHPAKDKLFYEWKPEKTASDEVDWIEIEIAALNAAQNLEIEMIEAVMRVEVGSEVSKMSSKELRRDALVYARNNPQLFLELVTDENIHLRNFGIKATEMNILKLSNDQRHFMWANNDRKLMTVPFDEHPYTALAHWFKTDEGMEIYANIEKRLKN
tara:strand:- start:126 stop:956 length:831 start_codon:yes stop_codon:yes gene_type:complete